MSAHPLLARVRVAMERIAPLALADSSWDNVGVLVEAPIAPQHAARRVVLLTVDLTPAVLEEAIAAQAAVVVAYHPIIFSGLKRLTLDNPTQSTVLRAIANGISIHCPHTSLDAASGGMNDWLVSLLGSGSARPIDPRLPNGKKPSNPNEAKSCNTGYGRLALLDQALTFEGALQRVKAGCGVPTVRVALPPKLREGTSINDVFIKTVAVCPGSGTGVFRGLPPDSRPDLMLTGEMGHHDVVAATEGGTIVMLCEHTNTERGFLSAVLRQRLQEELGNEAEVIVSGVDRDPLVVY
jgi:dinuclear metal center YbgI/SA1388 family protein